MRILHTADWHLGRTLEGRSRLEEQSAFLDELAQLVEDERIDLVLIAGDVYDSVNPPAAAEQLFYEGVARLAGNGKRQVIAIAGNHDHPDRLSASGPIAARQGIVLLGEPVAAVQTIDVARSGERACVFALPYPSESRLRELLSDTVDETSLREAYSSRIGQLLAEQSRFFSDRTVNLVMSHLYVQGGSESDSERPIQVGGAYTVETGAFHVGAQYTALGHLHRPQTLKADSLIRYSGSPLAYSFSETGQAKSVTVLDAAPGRAPQMTEVFVQSGRPLVRWEAAGGLEQVFRWIEEGKDGRAWIDLEIHIADTPPMELIQNVRKAHPGIVHIHPVFPDTETKTEAVSISRLPMEELFRRFYAKQTGGAEPDGETVELFLQLIRDDSLWDEEGDPR